MKILSLIVVLCIAKFSSAVNPISVTTDALASLQESIRTNSTEPFFTNFHPDFTTDSWCVSGFVGGGTSDTSACIEQPINKSEFYIANILLIQLFTDASTFNWTIEESDPSLSGVHSCFVVQTTSFVDALGFKSTSKLPTFVDIAKDATDGNKWKVIRFLWQQDTLNEQNIFCRMSLAFFGDDRPCNITQNPPQ